MGLKFNDMFPSRFFKADDLAQPLTVKIKEVKIEPLGRTALPSTGYGDRIFAVAVVESPL
jgi:hypothetical protein